MTEEPNTIDSLKLGVQAIVTLQVRIEASKDTEVRARKAGGDRYRGLYSPQLHFFP